MKTKSKKFLLLMVAGILATLGLGIALTQAVELGDPAPNIFELDGDTLNEGSNTQDDWENVLDGYDPNNPASVIAVTECKLENGCYDPYKGVLVDPPRTSIFVQGSKDIDDITDWRCRDQASPDKNELTGAFAIAYENVLGELIVYFGAERYDNSGDAVMGFWLLQNSIELDLDDDYTLECLPTGDGKFRTPTGAFAEHEDDDILIVAEFTTGGSVGTIAVYKWRTDGQGSDGNLDLIQFEGQSPDCTQNGAGDLCATINAQAGEEGDPPWDYIPKGSDEATPYIQYGFMEGGINLSEVFNQPNGGEVPCFSTFLAETRSSTSPTASQKDFVIGSFNVCGIDVTKACGTNTGDFTKNPFEYTYEMAGCYDNTGFGTVTDLTLTDALYNSTADEYNLPGDFNYNSLVFYNTATIPTDAECGYVGSADYGALYNSTTGAPTFDPDTDALAPGKRLVWRATVTSTINGAWDQVTASATGVGGGEISDAQADAQCDQRFPIGLSILKRCDSELVVDRSSGKLVARVDMCGSLKNEGEIELTNVKVTNTVGTRTYVIYNSATLGAGMRDFFYGSYNPSSLPDPPFPYTFSDTVRVTGRVHKDLAGGTVSGQCNEVSGTDYVECWAETSASCDLCEETSACPPPSR